MERIGFCDPVYAVSALTILDWDQISGGMVFNVLFQDCYLSPIEF